MNFELEPTPTTRQILLFSGFSPTNKFEGGSITKVGNGKTKELLQIFDIRGTTLSKIFASDNFKTFVTIDDAGIVYILNEIEILQGQNEIEPQKSNKPTDL